MLNKLLSYFSWILLIIYIYILFQDFKIIGLDLESIGINAFFKNVIALIVILTSIFLYLTTKVKTPISLKLLFILAIYFLFYSQNEFFGLIFDINVYTQMSLWIFLYLFFFIFFKQYRFSVSTKDNVIAIFVIYFGCLFIYNYISHQSVSHTWSYIESYFLITMIPFITQIESGKKRTWLIYFVGICVILAGKRTGMLAYLSAFLIYLYFQTKNGNKLKSSLTIVFVLLFFVFIIGLFWEEQLQNIIQRFENISDDGGSGRDEVFGDVLNRILRSTGSDYFWGHGYNSVIKTDIGFSAHNDFLEVAYDFGICGFMVYMAFVISILCKFKYKTNSVTQKEGIIISGILFVIFSLTSHMILQTTSIICLCAFWGYIDATYKNKNIGRK